MKTAFSYFLLSFSALFAQERLTETKFIAAVRLVHPDQVEQMDGQRYWMTAYMYFKIVDGREVLMCRPISVNAEIQVEFTCPQCEEEIRQLMKKSGSKRVKYNFSGDANCHYWREEKQEPEFGQIYYDDNGRYLMNDSSEEIERARMEYARKRGWIKQVPVTRLYAFTNAKKARIIK